MEHCKCEPQCVILQRQHLRNRRPIGLGARAWQHLQNEPCCFTCVALEMSLQKEIQAANMQSRKCMSYLLLCRNACMQFVDLSHALKAGGSQGGKRDSRICRVLICVCLGEPLCEFSTRVRSTMASYLRAQESRYIYCVTLVQSGLK
jgi:hypothetical protein